MKRLLFFLTCVLFLCLPALAQRRVLVIVYDDVGRDVIAEAPTPQLDRLAAQGIRFPNVWMAQSCSPMRSAAMSGMFSHRPENYIGHIITEDPGSTWSLPTATALPNYIDSFSVIGKWHLGVTSNEATHPLDSGAEYAWGSNFNLGIPANGGSYWNFDGHVVDGFYENGQPVGWTGYLTEVEGARAVQRIDAGDDLIWLSFHAIHKPYEAPPPHLHSFGDLSGADDHTLALAMLEAMDHVTGRVASYALARGITVVVTSDNGTSKAIGGDKGEMSEDSLRTFLYVIGPGITANESQSLVGAVDLFPTLTELVTGTSATTNDSYSFAGEVLGGAASLRPWLFVGRFMDNGAPPATVDWERAMRGARYKAVWMESAVASPTEFYDLLRDPGEDTNLLLGQLTGQQQAELDYLISQHP